MNDQLFQSSYLAKSPLSESTYRPQLTGHETFPLRYGWLKKACDAINNKRRGAETNSSVFTGDDAIARFGVGKNMVAAIRHWAVATKVIIDEPRIKQLEVTEMGDFLFGSRGLDPYLEHPSSLWLIHWTLATQPQKTTWYWAFSHFSSTTFDRDQLIQAIVRLVKERNWRTIASTTVKKDVICFIRTYASTNTFTQKTDDSVAESPLAELGLIKTTNRRDGFRFVRGSKPTLGDGVFTYSVLDFWSKQSSHSATLSFETIAHAPGSPGRTFVLDENDVVDRLINIEQVTNGKIRWSETAGLKQIVRSADFDHDELLKLLQYDYTKSYQD